MENEQESIQKSLFATQNVRIQLDELNSRIEKIQLDFHNNVTNINEIGNSNVRLQRFESIIEQIHAENSPVNLIAEQLLEIRGSLLPTQFDHANAILTDQKSRLADLLARSENRKCHLSDIIKEKDEFEVKLQDYQTVAIQAKSELQVPIEKNVSIHELSKQLQGMNQKQKKLSIFSSEYKQLRDVQLSAVKIGLPEIEQEGKKLSL